MCSRACRSGGAQTLGHGLRADEPGGSIKRIHLSHGFRGQWYGPATGDLENHFSAGLATLSPLQTTTAASGETARWIAPEQRLEPGAELAG
jgi:hypothetical protein